MIVKLNTDPILKYCFETVIILYKEKENQLQN
jgi:hypothetical protein